jgi:hypothetical protein
MAVVVAGMAGCGSSDPQPAATVQTQATTTTTTAKPANAEPEGKLSAPEYRSTRGAYRILQRLEDSNDLNKLVRAGNRACTKITTQTELLAAVHADCVHSIRFLDRARQMVARKAECTRAAEAGDISCFAELFRSLGRSARVESVHAVRVNTVLRKRGIHGRCAAAIGTSNRQLRSARAVVHDALGAAHALEARNQATFMRATSRLKADLDGTDDGASAAKTMRQLRSCV